MRPELKGSITSVFYREICAIFEEEAKKLWKEEKTLKSDERDIDNIYGKLQKSIRERIKNNSEFREKLFWKLFQNVCLSSVVSEILADATGIECEDQEDEIYSDNEN